MKVVLPNMDAEFRLPTSFVPGSLKKQVIGEDLLVLKEQYRVGTMMVRFSSLTPHPLQREVNAMWYKELAAKHFESGSNIQKGRYPMVVIAVKEGEIKKIDPGGGNLPNAMHDDKFYLISGQHRLYAMKHLIRARLDGEKGCPVHDSDVLQDPEAEWPAIVYRRGDQQHHLNNNIITNDSHVRYVPEFELAGGELFKTFMDSLNVVPSILENSPNQIWINGSSYTVANSSNRDAYIRSVVPQSTSFRGVIRALNHTRLREAVDSLIKIPMFELTISNLNLWSSLGSATVCWISFPKACRGG